MIQKTTELIIYTYHDGSTVAYLRVDGGNTTLVEDTTTLQWIRWKDIIQASSCYDALANTVKQAEFVYDLIK
jgi:hypothetical protein